MTVNLKSISRHLTFVLPLLLCSVAHSQQPPVDAPSGAATTVPPADVTVPALENNPAVRAALELPREKPADYFQAVSWLIDLGRPELAKPILEELTKIQLTDAQRSALVAEFGSRSMLQLGRTKELAPAGTEFANACMAAAAAAANNPQRIASLVARLTDPSAEVRELARNDLAAIGQPGAIAVLEALAKETNLDRRAALATGAARLHPFVAGPLLAMLDTADLELRASVAGLLDQLDVLQAVPLLQASPASAERALTLAIENYRHGTPPFAVDDQGQVDIWYWNDVEKKLGSRRYSVEQAKTIWMARLAIKRSKLAPHRREFQRQAIVLGLEAEDQTRNPPGVAVAAIGPFAYLNAVYPLVASADLTTVNDALGDSLKANYARAAGALIFELLKRGDANVLLTADGQPSPLANALVHPNRRVRFAALRAIMTLDPTSPYPGSSRVPDALVWFAGSEGTHQALVAMPTLAAATNLAGMLAAHDLDAEATNRGRDAVDLARDMPDLEVIFVDMNIIVPGIRQVLYELRVSPVTGDIPVALMAAESRLAAAERLAAEHDRVLAVSRPHSPEVLTRIVEDLRTLAGRDAVPADERVAQAAQARQWLETLASGRRPFYIIRRTALNSLPSLDGRGWGRVGIGRESAPSLSPRQSGDGKLKAIESPTTTPDPAPLPAQ